MTEFEGVDVPSISDIPTGITDIVNLTSTTDIQSQEGNWETLGENVTEHLDNLLTRIQNTLEGRDTNYENVSDVYSDKITDVMNRIFTPSVLYDWPTMSYDQRSRIMDLYARELGDELGIEIHGAAVADLYSTYNWGTQGLNSGDGWLHVDGHLMNDPNGLYDALLTTTHEARHQLQNEVIANPDNYPDIPREAVDIWADNFENYISPEDDFQGYQDQPVERDAREFADKVITGYMNELKQQGLVN